MLYARAVDDEIKGIGRKLLYQDVSLPQSDPRWNKRPIESLEIQC
jgi:hypothetical protein